MSYYRQSSMSRCVISNTDATWMVVAFYSDYPTGQKFYRLSKDGVSTYTLLGDGLTYKQIAITGITDIVITVGVQGNVSGVVQGTFIKSVQFFGGTAAIVTPSNPATRVYIYGDSITQGGSTVNGGLGAWPYQLRPFIPVLLDGWSGRHLNDDAVDAAARTAFVARITPAAPSIIWLAIGYNDYADSTWTAANFGAAYADVLDKLHAALPSAVIYAQTMIDASSDGINGVGSTLADYRTAIATEQSTRSAWCNLVDGTAIMSTAELVDGVHPNAAGHALYLAYVKTVLGL
jgi:lysophospholipase L1-like esterase